LFLKRHEQAIEARIPREIVKFLGGVHQGTKYDVFGASGGKSLFSNEPVGRGQAHYNRRASGRRPFSLDSLNFNTRGANVKHIY
jgi:hypothetical protein